MRPFCEGTVTSITDALPRRSSHSCAASRCESTAPGPQAITAASQRPSVLSRSCPTAYTPRCSRSNRPVRTHSSIPRALKPSATSCLRLTTPHWRPATLRSLGKSSFAPTWGHKAPNPGGWVPAAGWVGPPLPLPLRRRYANADRLRRPVANDLLFKPAGELATLVHTGQVSSTELVTAALESIEQLQPSLNAFVHIDSDGALEAAAKIGRADSRPFAGVPIAIKDTTSVAGMPYTMGSDMFGDFVPGHDSHVTRRIREAGFVLVGKTNMPEFGILPVTESRRYGPTRNPWDTDRTPGGSSGGAAAAVAAGMVPLAHGSDGGGSIRIPASCTGLVGLKPTRGRISRGPDLGDDFLVQDGVLTRTVAETASMLDVLSGYEVGDTTWAPPPSEPFVEAARREPGRLRIGFTTTAAIEAPIDPPCEQAVQDAVQLLAELGHEVEEITAPWGEQDLLQTFIM